MDDRTLVNTGMAYSEKTMEAADDVIQALIIALSGKSTAEQNHVLEPFAKHVQGRGECYAAQFDSEKLKAFQKAAEENGLAYYAVADMLKGKVSAIIKDCDIPLFERTVERMAKQGNPLYKDPQLYVAEFLDKYEGRNIVFGRIDSLEKVKAAKRAAVDSEIEFAVGRQQDNSYIVMYLRENHKALAEMGIVDGTNSPSALLGSVDVQEVKRVVEQERKRKGIEKEKQKEKRYER